MDRRPVMATGVARLLLISVIAVLIVEGQVVAQVSLSSTYYSCTCSSLNSILDDVVFRAIKQSRNIVGGLLRLHFHDCFVRIGGPSWTLPLGRRDGNTSKAGETGSNLPSPNALYAEIKNMFAAKGLSEQDMVVLSGAHIIGNTHCNQIERRLYNSTGPGGVDPNLDPTYAAQLKAECPFSNGKLTTIVPMDPTGGNDTFDSNYYSNVQAQRGLFISDATLLSNADGSKFVMQESSGPQYPFFSDFAQAMTRLASISGLLAPEGEVRQNCRVVNSPSTTK